MIELKRVCGVVEVKQPTDLHKKEAEVIEATPIEEKPKTKKRSKKKDV